MTSRSRTAIRHTSAHREAIADHNEGFREGICAAIDELRALGLDAVADALEARFFGTGEPHS